MNDHYPIYDHNTAISLIIIGVWAWLVVISDLWSDVVKVLIQVLAVLTLVVVLAHEHAQLLRVLQYPWNLNRPRPVHVVEALTVNQLLNDSLLDWAVCVSDFIVSRPDSPSVALLGDQVELETTTHCLSIDDRAWGRIDNVSALIHEELLRWVFVQDYVGQLDGVVALGARLEDLLHLSHLSLDVETSIELRRAIFDDEDLAWRSIAVANVFIEWICDDGSHIGLQFILRLEEVVGVEGRKVLGGVGTVWNDISPSIFRIFCSLNADEHDSWTLHLRGNPGNP